LRQLPKIHPDYKVMPVLSFDAGPARAVLLREANLTKATGIAVLFAAKTLFSSQKACFMK